jgi:hypothetical protein
VSSDNSENSSLLRVTLCTPDGRPRAQVREQNILSNGLLQDSGCLTEYQPGVSVAGYHDNPDTLITQPINQSIRPLPAAKIDVHNGHVGPALGGHTFGVSRGCRCSDDVSSPRLKQHLQSRTDMPRIFDHKDT